MVNKRVAGRSPGLEHKMNIAILICAQPSHDLHHSGKTVRNKFITVTGVALVLHQLSEHLLLVSAGV